LSNREIEDASLKAVVAIREYNDFYVDSEESFFAKLEDHWEKTLTQLRRKTRAENELKKILAKKEEINFEISQEVNWIVDIISEGIRAGMLTVTWKNDDEIDLGKGMYIKKTMGTLEISWNQKKKSFGFPLDQCKNLIKLLPYPEK
jgi:hypothetical protein